MRIKTKTKKKLPVTRIVMIAFASLTVIVLTLFLTKYFLQERRDQQLLREQKVMLDNAESDIVDITEGFIKQFAPNELNIREVKKDCRESSVKYGRGTITCGPTSFVRISTSNSLEKLSSVESTLMSLIDNRKNLTLTMEPFLDTTNSDEGRVFETIYSYMGNAGVRCHFTTHIYTKEQYVQTHKVEGLNAPNVITLSSGCSETTKEPIYPLRD